MLRSYFLASGLVDDPGAILTQPSMWAESSEGQRDLP